MTEIERERTSYVLVSNINGLDRNLGIKGEGREKWGLLLQVVETEQQREGPHYSTQNTPGSKLGPAPKEVGATLSKVSGTIMIAFWRL